VKRRHRRRRSLHAGRDRPSPRGSGARVASNWWASSSSPPRTALASTSI